MPARPPETILERFVQDQGKEGKLRRKLAANKERNWLLGLVLNSFARLDEGAELTDLEQSLVKAFRDNGISAADLKQHGRLYRQLRADLRRQIFSGKFAGLTARTPYTAADLEADAPAILQAVLGMPNVTVVDVEAIHAGRAHRSDFPMPAPAVLAEHAGALFVALAPNITPPNPRYTIKAFDFSCRNETGLDFLGSDEPYWVFGALSGSGALTTRSRVFERVNAGDSFSFGDNEGTIWGPSGRAEDLPPGPIGALVSLWEHDAGNPDAVKAWIAASFAAAGSVAAFQPDTWMAAVMAGVAAVVQWLVAFLDDDHIADQAIVFTRQVVEHQVAKIGDTVFLSRRFTDGDADYMLWIRVARVA
jgi:hypothetical protein